MQSLPTKVWLLIFLYSISLLHSHYMQQKVLIIVGPTASGKTSLAIILAKQFYGEIISADSRQVYRDINLLSGKVTAAEMDGVPHYLLDIVDPMNVYSASDFKRDATAAITKISTAGHLPIIAGGTFLYIDTLLGRISLPKVPPNAELRATLENLSNEVLLEQLTALDPTRASAIDAANPRRLIRALEVATALGAVPPTNHDEPYDSLTLGIDINAETLSTNIATRIHERLADGMLEELKTLVAAGVTHERLESLGLECRYLSRHLRGELTLDATIEALAVKTRQFAKRQRTWLKRDRSIHWFKKDDMAAIETTVHDFLVN